jgi:uroporphyrinogen-III synthase
MPATPVSGPHASDAAPLAGVRVAVTRADDDAGPLAEALRALGASVLVTPLIRIVPRPAPAIDVAAYDWVAFTSRHAVTHLLAALGERGSPLQVPIGVVHRPQVAAVGLATAAALAAERVPVDLVPVRRNGEALAEAMIAGGVGQGHHVLFPCAAGARDALPARLRAAGATVDEAVLYETIDDTDGGAGLRAALAAGDVEVVTLASPSAVAALVAHAGASLATRAHLVSIGPTTSEALRAAGLAVAAEARRAGAQALADAAATIFSSFTGYPEDTDG